LKNALMPCTFRCFAWRKYLAESSRYSGLFINGRQLSTARRKREIAGCFSGRSEPDSGRANSAAGNKSRKTLAGPLSAKTQRQLVRVLISSERLMYCKGKISRVRNKTSSSHSVLVSRSKGFYNLIFISCHEGSQPIYIL